MSPIKIDPDIMHGTPCFNGTRVPVRILFEVFQEGGDIAEFLDGWPSVSRDQIVAVLELACEKFGREAPAGAA